tara:strand:- start:6143 stop:6499 length:357 start_codon:yes stop_codon:yes gene_type:complete
MNNTPLDFPAIMSDGRALTSYVSSGLINSDSFVSLSDGSRIYPNDLYAKSLDFRNKLQESGSEIIKNNQSNLLKYISCTNCPDYRIAEPSLETNCEIQQCTFRQINEDGIGLINSNTN